MRVLVVGKGGREHALAHKLSESTLCEHLWVAPGNPGMEKSGVRCHPAETNADIVAFAARENIDLVILGPETAILSDLKEQLEKVNVAVFAPSARAALLESSKNYCKEILSQAGLKTATYKVALDLDSALDLVSVHDFSEPLVIKADGLAQGKGVAVVASRDKAIAASTELSSSYGFPLLFEECLVGPELSAFALCDGEDFVVLGTACDYKRVSSDPFSANTGGMGAYSPCDFLSAQDNIDIEDVFKRALHTMKASGVPFQGFLFAGLMKTEKGIYVLEFNVRMGDPETQALLPRIKSDLLFLIDQALKHKLKGLQIDLSTQSSVHVVLTSQGYPGKVMTLGGQVFLPELQNSKVYFSGVTNAQSVLINSGGRVLGVTALGLNRTEARRLAYMDLEKIRFPGCYYRKDIGL